MGVIFRFLLFLVFFYLLFNTLRKLFVKPFQEGYRQKNRPSHGQEKEGKVTVIDPKGPKNTDKLGGEYIDYEELDEDEDSKS